MSNNKVAIQIDPGNIIEIEGKQYEAIAFRCPGIGEVFLDSIGDTVRHGVFDCPRLILRELPPPAKPRRVPTDADAIHRPRCWVRDYENKPWEEAQLLSVAVTEYPFSTTSDNLSRTCWRFCEIEDVDYGPVYHWRDATRNDLHQQFLVVNRGEKYWANTYLTRFFFDDIETGLRVLVEVGK
jgi:hypothetical protein